jgi:hypothetical protein
MGDEKFIHFSQKPRKEDNIWNIVWDGAAKVDNFGDKFLSLTKATQFSFFFSTDWIHLT